MPYNHKPVHYCLAVLDAASGSKSNAQSKRKRNGKQSKLVRREKERNKKQLVSQMHKVGKGWGEQKRRANVK